MSAHNEAKLPVGNHLNDQRLQDWQTTPLPSHTHRDGHTIRKRSDKVLTALLLVSLTISEAYSPEALKIRHLIDLLSDLQDAEDRATTVRRLYNAITDVREKLD